MEIRSSRKDWWRELDSLEEKGLPYELKCRLRSLVGSRLSGKGVNLQTASSKEVALAKEHFKEGISIEGELYDIRVYVPMTGDMCFVLIPKLPNGVIMKLEEF
jgi:hypothetical protein